MACMSKQATVPDKLVSSSTIYQDQICPTITLTAVTYGLTLTPNCNPNSSVPKRWGFWAFKRGLESWVSEGVWSESEGTSKQSESISNNIFEHVVAFCKEQGNFIGSKEFP